MKNLLLLLLLLLPDICLSDKFIPYYVSIKSSEVNVRKGPNARYQIDWVYKNKGEPVEVIAKFEHWNRIKDVTGDEGWVKSVMLSKKRSAVIIINMNKNNKSTDTSLLAPLHRKPDASSRIFAKIEASKRVFLEECQKQYCKIKVEHKSRWVVGWIDKQYLWGVYANEVFK